MMITYSPWSVDRYAQTMSLISENVSMRRYQRFVDQLQYNVRLHVQL